MIVALSKVRYQEGLLAWAVDIKTGKITYLNKQNNHNSLFFSDPNQSIIGIFVKSGE
jgi:hypothetical protein